MTTVHSSARPAGIAPAGAVLCGGASRRMGRDKAVLAMAGRPMALLVADALRGAGCSPVVAVGAERPELVAGGLTAVADAYPGQGPLGGVITALRHEAGSEMVAVVACDLPYLTARTIRALAEALAEAEPEVVGAVASADRLQPLCAVWRTSALPLLDAVFASGERRMLAVLREAPVLTVPVEAGELVNVNTPDDLRL